jgi:hypothetical protein
MAGTFDLPKQLRRSGRGAPLLLYSSCRINRGPRVVASPPDTGTRQTEHHRQHLADAASS